VLKIKILIADDHPMLREAMRNTFEQHKDIEVVGEAGDGQEAVDLSAKLKPDVVVMDIVMPKLNGIEATKEIRKISPSTKVLILTAYDDDRYIIGLLEAGAVGYLLKSARGHDLVEAVRAVYSGESVLHPTIIAKLLKHGMQRQAEEVAPKSGGQLSARELEVLKLTAKGMSNKEIALALSLTTRTVKAHLGSIFGKLSVSSRTEAIVKAVREGWLVLEKL
jgi:NarL family two-component system response regulator LiaR